MTSIRVLLLAGTLTLLVGCNLAHSDVNLFSLRALPLEFETPWQVVVPSLQSGSVAALCSSGRGKVENVTVTRFLDGDNRLTADLSIPRAGVQPHPKLLLMDNRLLTSGRDSTKEGADYWKRKSIIFELVQPDSGEVRDITPTNLDETTMWRGVCGPPMLWTDTFGLALFIADADAREIHLWQGRETLKLVQIVLSSLALGETFVAGVLTRVVVTDDGEALVYDYDTGRMKESPEHQALAAHIAEAAARTDRWPLSFVMAEDIAAFKWGQGAVFVLLAADGSRQTLRRRDPFEERPDGSRRSQAEGDALSLNPSRAIQTFTEEARATPPEIVSNSSVLVPVDEKRIGILDLFYQRLVVIGPPEVKSEQ